jgi:type I restriction enzyme, S subunit
MSDALADIEAEEFRAYPKSVQPGIPSLGVTPSGWQELQLGDLLSVVQRPAKMDDDASYELVTARRNRGGIVSRGLLTGKQIATKSQFWVEVGDFIMSRRQIAHGACGVLPQGLNGALVSNEYAALLPTERLDRGYLRHLPHSIYFQQTCFHSSIGVHVEKLVFNLEHWLTWPYLVPPLPEQRRIAAVLDAWDTAIATAERLVAAKRSRKAALAHDLLTKGTNADVQLDEACEINARPLGCLIETVSVRGYQVTTDQYTESGDHPIVDQGKSLICGYTSDSEPLPCVLPVTVFGDHTRETKFITFPFVVGADGTKVLTGADNQNPRYLHALIEYAANRITDLGYSRHFKELKDEIVPYTDARSEQRRIAEVLEICDLETELAETSVTLLRHQKRGLMQQLLTGKLRVPVSIDRLMPDGGAHG